MIVKYLTNKFQGSWGFISDVTSFEHSEISENQRKVAKKNLCINAEISLLDGDGKINENNKDYGYFSAWHKNSDKAFEVITNGPVYLLNDHGKTIERIH